MEIGAHAGEWHGHAVPCRHTRRADVDVSDPRRASVKRSLLALRARHRAEHDVRPTEVLDDIMGDIDLTELAFHARAHRPEQLERTVAVIAAALGFQTFLRTGDPDHLEPSTCRAEDYVA